MSERTLEPSDAEQKSLANGIKWVNRTPYIAAFVLFVLIAAYATAFKQNGWPTSPEAWGQLGDYIGGLLNPLVAGFALMSLVVSVRLQKAELAETRKELENSRLAMEEQAKTAEQQRREQRFFDFLAIYQATLQSISFEAHSGDGYALSRSFDSTIPPVSTRTGKQAFLFLTSSRGSPIGALFDLFQSKKLNTSNSREPPTSEIITNIWNQKSPVLDHYFRTVFMLLREAEVILKEDHFRYIKLFRAQLSRDEVNLLAMNLLFDDEGKKMRLLTASYGILKHMPSNHLRAIAERELDPLSFGRKWAARQFVTQREEIPC